MSRSVSQAPPEPHAGQSRRAASAAPKPSLLLHPFQRLGIPAMWQPWLVLSGVCLVTALLGVHDPHDEGSYGLCPFKFLTGLDDPGCGTLRAIHHLANGELAAAADDNLLFVVTVPLFAVVWLRWTIRTMRELPPVRLAPNWAMFTWLAFAGVFWVVRNLPYGPGPYLQSG